MKIQCDQCGNIIVKKRKQHEKLDSKDWEISSDKRKLSLRLLIEELEFLEKHAGWGKRATLVHLLLKEYIDRENDFLEIISRQKKLEEDQVAGTT